MVRTGRSMSKVRDWAAAVGVSRSEKKSACPGESMVGSGERSKSERWGGARSLSHQCSQVAAGHPERHRPVQRRAIPNTAQGLACGNSRSHRALPLLRDRPHAAGTGGHGTTSDRGRSRGADRGMGRGSHLTCRRRTGVWAEGGSPAARGGSERAPRCEGKRDAPADRWPPRGERAILAAPKCSAPAPLEAARGARVAGTPGGGVPARRSSTHVGERTHVGGAAVRIRTERGVTTVDSRRAVRRR